MAYNCHGKRSNLAEKTPRQKEKTHGGESWPSGFFFCRESFPFCGEVPPFVASLSLLPRGYLFCRDSCGPSYFLLPLTHKAEIQGSLLFFFLQDRTLLSFPHNIPTLSHRNVGRICIVIYAGFVLTYFLLVPLFYEKDSICLTLGACRKITAAETHPIMTEEIIISLSNTCDAALHSSCHSII